MVMNNFLDLDKISSTDLDAILEDAHKLKKQSQANSISTQNSSMSLNNTITGLLFEKLSTRTRLSFEAAALKLGGKVVNIRNDEIHLGQGETLEDTIAMFSLFLDVLVLRVYEENKLLQFAKYSKIPIINGLTNQSHPCQVLTDIFTFQEIRGKISGRKVVWLGVANNVFQSFLHAAVMFKFKLVFCGPEKFQPSKEILGSMSEKELSCLTIEQNPVSAVKDSDLIVTDKWMSMHEEPLSKVDLDTLANYSVSEGLLDNAKQDVLFMHCLPAAKGQEVSQNIFVDERCVVLKEAENRMHLQKSILRWCLNAF